MKKTIFTLIATIALTSLVACQPPLTAESSVTPILVAMTPQPPIFVTNTPNPTFITTSTPNTRLPFAALTTETYTPEILPTPMDYSKLAWERYLTPYITSTPHPTEARNIDTAKLDALSDQNSRELLADIEVRTMAPSQLSVPNSKSEQATKQYIQSVTDIMNITQGNESAYLEYVAKWVPGTSIDDLKYVWIYPYDLDKDGALEWLVSVPLIRPALIGSRPPGHAKQAPTSDDWIGCMPGVVCPRMVLLFERSNGLFKPVSVLLPDIITEYRITLVFNTPAIILIEDLNRDGILEVLLESKWQGASTSGSELYIGGWDGKKWRYFGWINQSFAKFTFEDWNQDGKKDILAHGGTTGDMSFYPQRPHTEIYA